VLSVQLKEVVLSAGPVVGRTNDGPVGLRVPPLVDTVTVVAVLRLVTVFPNESTRLIFAEPVALLPRPDFVQLKKQPTNAPVVLVKANLEAAPAVMATLPLVPVVAPWLTDNVVVWALTRVIDAAPAPLVKVTDAG
jgi:hypothetical protein